MTAMSAFHWFDRPRFLQEAHRVLKPHGCLALLNYTLDMELSHEGCPSDTLNAICEEVITGRMLKCSGLSRNMGQDPSEDHARGIHAYCLVRLI